MYSQPHLMPITQTVARRGGRNSHFRPKQPRGLVCTLSTPAETLRLADNCATHASLCPSRLVIRVDKQRARTSMCAATKLRPSPHPARRWCQARCKSLNRLVHGDPDKKRRVQRPVKLAIQTPEQEQRKRSRRDDP